MQRLKLDSSIDKEDEGRVWKAVTHFEWLISDYVIIFRPFQTLLFDATPTAETAPADEWAFILTLEKKQHQKWRPCRKKVLKNTIRPLEKKHRTISMRKINPDIGRLPASSQVSSAWRHHVKLCYLLATTPYQCHIFCATIIMLNVDCFVKSF